MGGFPWVMCGSNKEWMTLKLRKSGEKVSDVVFPLYLYVRNVTVSSSNLLFIWVCMEIFHDFRSVFVLYFFCFLLLDMKMLNKLYTCKLYKLINLCWSTGCFVKLYFTPRDDFIDGFSTVNIQDLAGLCC